ncbi:hypothetical protein [Streptomyces sp. NPDC057910]|uniref:hypothetical protein n=1 Tax=Streptomyces sp. NPDC057910 TaxID=3346278 RepID=UPI0036EDBF8B
MHHLNLRRGDQILEIGTGTGYNAALLAHLAGAVNLVTPGNSAAMPDRQFILQRIKSERVTSRRRRDYATPGREKSRGG